MKTDMNAFRGKGKMAKENNTSSVSEATLYLRDNDMLRCCHLIQRNKNKRAYL